jgi:alpha-galactosidase
LLHGGDLVRVEPDDPHAFVHGVIAGDRSHALFAYVQLTSAQALLPRPVRVPGLDPDRTYRVSLVDLPGGSGGRRLTRDPMPVETGLELSGRQLAAHGVRLPVVNAESVELLWIEEV